MDKLYFIIGSQDLYGEETLKQAEKDGYLMAEYLDGAIGGGYSVESLPIVQTAQEAENLCIKASSDKECIGVILWMHTFSPAKCGSEHCKHFASPCFIYIRNSIKSSHTRPSIWIL